MEDKIRELQELKRMRRNWRPKSRPLRTRSKAGMGEREELTAGAYKVTWKPVTSRRIDTAAMKKALPEVCERFMKETVVRRFCVN